MPDSYTYVSKPTSSTYSYVNFQGKQTYDQSDIEYDDASVFYDSINDAAYTYISKPTLTTTWADLPSGATWTDYTGTPWSSFGSGGSYVIVPKPTT